MADYVNPNRAHIIAQPSEEVDWAAFRRSQEPHSQAFASMMREYEQQYDDPRLNSKEREDAGFALGYSQLRIDVHELIGVLIGRFESSIKTSLI